MSLKKQAFVLTLGVLSVFFSATTFAADSTDRSERIWMLIKGYDDYDKTGQKHNSMNIKSYGQPKTYPSTKFSDDR